MSVDQPADAPAGSSGPSSGPPELIEVVVSQRVQERDCEACGQAFVPAKRGRPPRYCSAACRQRGWALREAERALGTEQDRRPTVVREVVEQVRERVVRLPAPPRPPVPAPSSAKVPRRAREWVELLGELTGQLADNGTATAREHWQHRRLYDALAGALVELGKAHPGGLDQLHGRR